jgi:hypothetical protein
METNLQSAEQSLSDEVTRLSDTIHSCERLCLLTTRTVLLCAISPTKDVRKEPPVAFIPSVSRNLQNVPPLSSTNPHPTTSAHCVTALQNLLPVIGRFQFGTHESKGLAFHPIERDSLDVFKPKAVSGEIRSIIKRAVKGLESPEAESESKDKTHSAKEQRDASRSTSAEQQNIESEPSTFSDLHPFRAAQVLRAIAPSHAIFHPVAWRSLFAVVWYLHRRSGSPRSYPNIQETDSPGTALLTSKCVEAIEAVLSVFERRRERFKRLFEVMTELRRIVKGQEELANLGDKLISTSTFSHGYSYKTSILIPEVRACLAELACDSALPMTYQKWSSDLASAARSPTLPRQFKSAQQFLLEVVNTFRATMRNDEVKKEHETTKLNIDSSVSNIENIERIVRNVHAVIVSECNPNKN